MSYFLKKGKSFRLTSKETLDIHDKLPTGTYAVGLDGCTGQYTLDVIDPFEINHKLYGDTTRNTDRIMRTFLDRTSTSTGVLLTGEKGSGKTLLAKNISIEAAKQGIPTLVVNQGFHGDGFNTFMQMIEQPTVVLFDEFEKVYEGAAQEKMLTLLDGVYPSQKLFVLTCNDKWRVDQNMRNRPGRIFYVLDFDGLSPEFIRQYCEDNLMAKEYIESVVTISTIFRTFNFDMLKGMVEEMNRYGECPADVLKFLNARPAFGQGGIEYTVKLRGKDGKVYSGRKDGVGNWSGNPLLTEVLVHYSSKSEKGGRRHIQERFTAADLVSMNSDTRSYIFKNKKGVQAALTPKKTEFSVNFDKIPTTYSNANKKLLSSPEDEDDSEDKPWDGMCGMMDVTEDESIGDY